MTGAQRARTSKAVSDISCGFGRGFRTPNPAPLIADHRVSPHDGQRAVKRHASSCLGAYLIRPHRRDVPS